MWRSGAKTDEGPIAQKDDPCQEPGPGAKPCNHTRRRVPAAWVLFSASSRDISHPHLPLLQPPFPKHCFLQRGNAWSWLHLPATSPFLGSELRHYFCLVMPCVGGWQSLFAHHPPAQRAHHVHFCWFLSHFTNLRAASPIFEVLKHKGLKGSTVLAPPRPPHLFSQ